LTLSTDLWILKIIYEFINYCLVKYCVSDNGVLEASRGYENALFTDNGKAVGS